MNSIDSTEQQIFYKIIYTVVSFGYIAVRLMQLISMGDIGVSNFATFILLILASIILYFVLFENSRSPMARLLIQVYAVIVIIKDLDLLLTTLNMQVIHGITDSMLYSITNIMSYILIMFLAILLLIGVSKTDIDFKSFSRIFLGCSIATVIVGVVSSLIFSLNITTLLISSDINFEYVDFMLSYNFDAFSKVLCTVALYYTMFESKLGLKLLSISMLLIVVSLGSHLIGSVIISPAGIRKLIEIVVLLIIALIFAAKAFGSKEVQSTEEPNSDISRLV